MAANPTGFLVQKLDDGFGDVFPLLPGQRYTVGRAPDNRIVLRDDLCSRDHAEVFADGGGWAVRDLGSLNGTARQRRARRAASAACARCDEVRLGRLAFVFVETLDQLPDLPPRPGEAARTRPRGWRSSGGSARPSTSPPPVAAGRGDGRPRPGRRPDARAGRRPSTALAVLYRLALDMAEAADPGRTGRAGRRRAAGGDPGRGRGGPRPRRTAASWSRSPTGTATGRGRDVPQGVAVRQPRGAVRPSRRSWPRTWPATATCGTARAWPTCGSTSLICAPVAVRRADCSG